MIRAYVRRSAQLFGDTSCVLIGLSLGLRADRHGRHCEYRGIIGRGNYGHPPRVLVPVTKSTGVLILLARHSLRHRAKRISPAPGFFGGEMTESRPARVA